jgi:hypothetical protein
MKKTPSSYTINLTNGKKLLVDKNKVHSEVEHRIIYVGSLKEICHIPFLFTKMKETGMHELWHSYFTPALKSRTNAKRLNDKRILNLYLQVVRF